MKLYRIKKSNIDKKGRGLYATQDIRAGTKIIDYVGKLITKKQTEESDQYDNGKPIYLFTINKRYDLDGDFPWNTAGLINHSCDNNCDYDGKGLKIWVKAIKDIKIIKKGAKKLVGTNDYSTFRSSSCHAKSPIKTIKSIKIKSTKNRIEIEFKSQSFLQQQVRSMVGCLKYLGEKKWDLKTFDKVFKSKKRVMCAPPAPPEGLFLARVVY